MNFGSRGIPVLSSLLVDVGNSRIKWAIKRGSALQPGAPVQAGGSGCEFDRIWKNLEPPSRVLVSNVLGDDFVRALQSWTRDHWSLSAEFVRTAAKEYGVENAYTRPAQLGVDRWVCMIAARTMFMETLCIVDCGTAITADIVDSTGRHRGGVICPGLNLMRQSLVRGTRNLSFEGLGPGALLGRDTGSGIYSGTLTAAAGMIEKILIETESLLDCKPKLLITGGDAPAVIARLGLDHVHIPDLVLQGLAVIDALSMENRSS